MMNENHGEYLKRLPVEQYRGESIVHWTMTMQDRATGWLTDAFHHKFRELLTHTMIRYRVCCPIYCCMPDHFHLLWMGLCDETDQRNGMKFFRKYLNAELKSLGVCLQQQAYDHVLRENEKQEQAFEELVEYIARNPERKNLVSQDCFLDYQFSGSLLPGYPDCYVLQAGGWERFWKIYSQLKNQRQS